MLMEQPTTTISTSTPWNRVPRPAVPAAAGRMRLASDSAERRRGLRVRQARPIKLLDATAGRIVAGQTLDISVTGLRVELPVGAGGAGLRVGDVLGVHVGLSRIGERLANRRQMVPVRVVWLDHDGGRDGFLVAGVEFSASISAQRDAA